LKELPIEGELQDALVTMEPDHYFKPLPSKSGTFGNWLGVYLDISTVDWIEIESLLEGAFRLVAPKMLIVELDNDSAQASKK
jgi:hypothetical protein